MEESLRVLLRELEDFGTANDSVHRDRPKRMLNITPDTGEFLLTLVLATSARQVLEIGTSNGYSTIWLASAVARTHGRVTTVDKSDYKISLAQDNFRRSGLESVITLVKEDAQRVLGQQPEGSCDLIFLDSERSEYLRWWPPLKRALRAGGSLVVDNATSHLDELASFMALVKSDPNFVTSLLPVGNGEFFAVRTE